MKVLWMTLGLVLATTGLASRPASAHWVSLSPPPYAYQYAYPYPYASPGYPPVVPAPYASCVVGPAGPVCGPATYYPGWQYRREWDTDYIWRNSGPHVRGYTLR